MKINLNNVYYSKPILNYDSDDFIDNKFNVFIIDRSEEKNGEKDIIHLKIQSEITNKLILEQISLGNITPLIHIEQMAIRKVIRINVNDITEIELDALDYTSQDNIEIIGILFCSKSFEVNDKKYLNNIYSIMSGEIAYERGDIVGYSTQCELPFSEDKKVGSIFNVVSDEENTLHNEPYSINLNHPLIIIIVNKDLYSKYTEIYKKNEAIKRMDFSLIVYPALYLAISSMFLEYETYKKQKWCQSIIKKLEISERKTEQDLLREEYFRPEIISKYVNIIAGDLFKDSVNKCSIAIEEGVI